MTESDRFMELLQLGREERFLEFKESLPWDDIKHKVAKTALSMANIRDGGTIIIGVSQREGCFSYDGIQEDHLATYDEDEVRAYINRFADPYIHISLHNFDYENKKYIAIVVHEFDIVPIVCKKDSGNFMREGAIYTRSNRIPETCEIRSQTEMRELIEIAIEKGVREFLRKIKHIGINIEELKTDREQFENETQDITDLPLPIIDTPYLQVIIRPLNYQSERISSLSECWKLIESCKISLRGWDYPHLNHELKSNGQTWIASWIKFMYYQQYWRFYQSGHFIHFLSFKEDLDAGVEERAKSILNIPDGFSPSGYLTVINTLYLFTEIFEFAARLAQKGIFEDGIFISIKMLKIRNRVLFQWSGDFYRFFHATEDILYKELLLKIEDILSNSSNIAIDMLIWFFERFQWINAPRQFFAVEQAKFLEGKI